jgi:hypothetical protein
MAVTLDNHAIGSGGNGYSRTFSYTSSTSANRAILVKSHIASQPATGVTYAGTSLTKYSAFSGDATNVLWTLAGQSTGANNVVLTWSAYSNGTALVSSYTDVDQTTPFGTAVQNTASNYSPTTGSITCPTNGMVDASVWHGYVTATPTSTAGTELDNYSTGGTWYMHGYRASTGAVSWTVNRSATWYAIAVPINPVSAGGSATNRQYSFVAG